MMISLEDIRKTSKLSKLSFSEENLSDFAAEINKIIIMIDSLAEVDTDDVEPLRSVLDMKQRLDEDIVNLGDISQELFQNIPDQGKELANSVKCFVVPKVVE